MYRQALTARERAYGADQPELAVTIHNLAMLCEETGRPAEAMALYGRAVSMLDAAAVEPTHPTLRACRAALAKVAIAAPPNMG
jgi:hypothetical protein